MSLEFEIPLVSLFLILILMFFYFLKPKIKLIENKYYAFVLVLSFFESLLSVIAHIITARHDFNIITTKYYSVLNIINRLVSTSFVAIFLCLFIYILLICNKDNRKYEKIMRVIGTLFIALFFIVTRFTNIEILRFGSVTNIRGSTISLGYIFVFIFMISSIVLSLINVKKMDMRFLSIYLILPILVIIYIVTLMIPGIILYDFGLAVLCYIMYFTIENPDLKLLNEYINNKELLEMEMQEKSNVLFKITQDVRNPINNITSLSEKIINSGNLQNIHDNAYNINNISRQTSTMINEVLNITSFNSNNIKITDAEYDIYKLFATIVFWGKENAKNIDFKYNIDEYIPNILLGDSLIIKQIVCSLLFNAIKHTQDGFVDLDISAIVKDDICRLIIVVRNTGHGINLREINNILEPVRDGEYDYNKLSLDMNLKQIKQFVGSQKGSMNIISNNNETEVTLFLDQKISIKDNYSFDNKFSISISNKLKVLLFDDDFAELKTLAKHFKGLGYNVVQTMYGKDCIDKLKKHEKFDYVILDDESEKYNAVEIMESLSSEDKKNTKIIVLIGKEKDAIKGHYIDDYGFDDYLLKSNYKDEIKRILS